MRGSQVATPVVVEPVSEAPCPGDEGMRERLVVLARHASKATLLTVPSVNRTRVAAALHQLSLERYTGLHVLVGAGVPSAAFALYRPQLEAYIRGAWYHRCATDEQIDDFIAGEEPPSPKKQMMALERSGAFDPGSLVRLKEMTWKNLCDFTHGGAIQVKARAAKLGQISQNFKLEHVAALLTSSATTAFLASIGIAAVADDEQTVLQLRDAFNSIYPKLQGQALHEHIDPE